MVDRELLTVGMVSLKRSRPSTKIAGYSVCFLSIIEYYFVAGAGAAPGAGAGVAGAGAVPPAGAGPGAGAGAGAGASTFGASGFGSSAFLQPMTAKENVTKKSRERIRANTFFINLSPPFNHH
jgi:hypothetical protein